MVLCGLAGAGCATGPSADSGDREITVLAAASLTDVFPALAEVFERRHPRVRVRFAFDSSAWLADRAVEGAPGDVLATADALTMRRAGDGGVLAGRSHRFARNVLVVVTPEDNPGSVSTTADLGTATYVACVSTAPCGRLADRLLAANGVDAPPASRELDVRAVLRRVRMGEADAGLVYRTDARAAGEEVRTIPIPGASRRVAEYRVAVLRGAADDPVARAWVAFLRGPGARPVLADAGFGPP